MEQPCPRCHTVNPDAARYCRQCGLVLVAGPRGLLGAGRLRHPDPVPVPEGFQPFETAPDLFYRWEAAWGGEVLLGTETLAVTVFNAGYSLVEVRLRVRGENEAGEAMFSVEREISEWPRGAQHELEIPSWELRDPARTLLVSLVSAEFGPEP